MTTAIDSNVLIGLWNEDDLFNTEAKRALLGAGLRGPLVIAAPVYVEIRSMQDRTERLVESLLAEIGIVVDWALEEPVWRTAAAAGHEYGRRRHEHKGAALPRRIAADFMIGAHAALRGFDLLTFDKRSFRTSFPGLRFAPESS